MLIEASITAGVRPTSMLLHAQPGKKWNEFDFLCIEAYQGVLAERCAQCGLPRWICHNDDDDVRFKPVQDVCYATREVEQFTADIMDKKKDKDKYGVKVRPEPFTQSGGPLDGVVREAFYKAQYEKANPES